MAVVNNIKTINLQQSNEGRLKLFDQLPDAIQEFQFKVRRKTKDKTFNATRYLADRCGVTTGTFYKWLEGDYNNTKLGLQNFADIIVETEDLSLLDSFAAEVQQRIELKKMDLSNE